MGGKLSAATTRTDFEWMYTEQCHVSRRKAIIDKHPEIKKLMGPEPRLIYAISLLVVIDIASTYLVVCVADLSYFWTTVVAYCFAGFINHCLFVGIHDVSHNVVYGNSRPLANRLFGIWANLPLIIPMSASFKKYHMDHHRFLGTEGLDTDLPTDWEGRFFGTPFFKVVFIFLYPFFYGIRPLIVRPMALTRMEALNLVVQLTFDVSLAYFWGIKAFYYLLIATYFSLGPHPMAAHFIAEHYMFDRGYETYSYYGNWNILTWNIGYHMEHHDFPYIACTRLPQVNRIASEFYDTLPQHETWFGVWWEFVTSPAHSPYSRVKRHYDEVYGEKKGDNRFVGSNNMMKPVGFKSDDDGDTTTTTTANGSANGGIRRPNVKIAKLLNGSVSNNNNGSIGRAVLQAVNGKNVN